MEAAPLARLFREVLEALSARTGEVPFLADICRLAVAEAGFDAALAAVPEEAGLRPAAWAGNLPPALTEVFFPLDEAPEGNCLSRAYRAGAAVLPDSLAADPVLAPFAAALGGCLALPLDAAGEVLGILALFASGPQEVRARREVATWLARAAALGLRERRLTGECRRLQGELAAYGQGLPEATWGRLLQELSGVGLLRARLPGFALLAANRGLARMLGYESPGELLREYVPADQVADPGAWDRFLAGLVRGGEGEGEIRLFRRQGSVATLRLRGSWDPREGVYDGVAWEVDPQRRREAELEELAERHRQLTEQYVGGRLLWEREREDLARELHRERQVSGAALAACEAGVLAYAADGRLTHWNHAMEVMTGLREAEVRGKEVGEVLAPIPGLTHGRRTPAPVIHRGRLTPGGEEGVWEATLTPLWGADGRPAGGVIMLKPRPPAPEPAAFLEGAGPGLPPEVRLRQERLEALGSLALSLAHDFANILGVMLGYTEMAQADLPEDDPRKHRLEQVLTAGRRGQELVQQILAFSRSWQAERPPLAEPAPEPPPGAGAPETSRETPGVPSRGRGRILFAAGEEGLGDMWPEILHSLGYDVHTARSGPEVLEILLSRPEAADLLLVDQNLPAVSGLEVAEAIRARHPAVPVILCVDVTDPLTLEKAKAAGVREFLLKPLSFSDLSAALNRLLPPRLSEGPSR